MLDFEPPLVMWRYIDLLPSALLVFCRLGLCVWCGLMAVGRLCQNPPGIVIVCGWKCPVVRVLMRGVKWASAPGGGW